MNSLDVKTSLDVLMARLVRDRCLIIEVGHSRSVGSAPTTEFQTITGLLDSMRVNIMHDVQVARAISHQRHQERHRVQVSSMKTASCAGQNWRGTWSPHLTMS